MSFLHRPLGASQACSTFRSLEICKGNQLGSHQLQMVLLLSGRETQSDVSHCKGHYSDGRSQQKAASAILPGSGHSHLFFFLNHFSVTGGNISYGWALLSFFYMFEILKQASKNNSGFTHLKLLDKTHTASDLNTGS